MAALDLWTAVGFPFSQHASVSDIAEHHQTLVRTIRRKSPGLVGGTGMGDSEDTVGPLKKWVFFKANPDGRETCREELDDLDPFPAARLVAMMERHERGATPPRGITPLGDGIWEVRVTADGNIYRLLFSYWAGKYVALTVFCKKQQKTPKKDLKRAKTRRKSWERRNPPPARASRKAEG